MPHGRDPAAGIYGSWQSDNQSRSRRRAWRCEHLHRPDLLCALHGTAFGVRAIGVSRSRAAASRSLRRRASASRAPLLPQLLAVRYRRACSWLDYGPAWLKRDRCYYRGRREGGARPSRAPSRISLRERPRGNQRNFLHRCGGAAAPRQIAGAGTSWLVLAPSPYPNRFRIDASRYLARHAAVRHNHVSKPTAGETLQSFRLLPAGLDLTRR
jgi:hypothetical protein